MQAFLQKYSLYTAVALAIAVLTFLEPLSSKWLMFDRELIDQGQVWRLLTCHFVHLSNVHAFNNFLGLMLFAYIAGPYLNNWLGLGLIVWSLLWVGLGLYVYADYLELYVGLSGVLHGWLIVGPFISTYYQRWLAVAFACVIVAKTIWEQTPWYDDMALAETIGGRVETNAHMFGTLSGITFLLIYFLFLHLKQRSENTVQGL